LIDEKKNSGALLSGQPLCVQNLVTGLEWTILMQMGLHRVGASFRDEEDTAGTLLSTA
jgi:hypothetical protein